jgi:phytoene dehydrogenase-like protein
LERKSGAGQIKLVQYIMADNKYDTIVVGAGIAGLTASAYLARSKQKVLLVEKNKECGGLVSTFTHNGFSFDAGVRALEDAGIILPMLKDLNIKLDIVKSPVTLRIENEFLHIEDLDSLEEYRILLIKLYPNSEDEIDNIIKVIKKIMKHMDVLYGIENPIFKDLKRDTNFIFKNLLPWLPKFILTVGKINKMNVPVEEYLESHIKNQSLRDIISQHFFKDTPTFFALSYFSLYLDYFYPIGGIGKIADVLVKKIVGLKGEIKNETTITKISANDKYIQDAKGHHYFYENLIWASDLKTLYRISEINEDSLVSYGNLDETKNNILNSRGSDSVFTMFLEVDDSLEIFKKISNGHFFYTPSKKGLGNTHRDVLRDMIKNWQNVKRETVITWLDNFISLNTYEISIPGLKDPNLVPDGKTGLIISFLAEYDLFKAVQESGWYEEFVNQIESRILDIFSDTIYPDLKNKIINYFSFTPLSIENRIGSSEGAIVGWSFENQIPVVNKIQYSDKSVITPFPNIYQAGQWAYSPAGVPMCILTGKLAADKIIKKKKSN